MILTEPDKVASQIQLMRDAETQRGPQRAILNAFFNGEPPWTQEEAKKNQIYVNYNNKQGANLLHQARNQYENAFSRRSEYFKVLLPDCEADDRADYEAAITGNINAILKKSREWYYRQDEVWGAVCLHGVGAKVWYDDQEWLPEFKGIQDMLIPTDTHLDMGNLQCLALRRKMRPGQLFRKTLGAGKNVSPAWNLKAVRKLLDDYKDLNQNPNQYNFSDHPEQMVELWKQQAGGYYDSDATPEIWMWDFFHREEGENGLEPGWYRKIMLDRDCVQGAATNDRPLEFFYDSKKPFADKLGKIIHFQFGDGNNVPPFMYHSIRSLTYLTYDLVWWLNRLQCQFTQHLFEELMTMLRIQDPADRGRLSRVFLQPPFGIIPEGLSFVQANERYQPDANLLAAGMAQYKQQIGEVSTMYTQQIDTGTEKERTKFEVQAILAQTSALMSSMLSRAYQQEQFAYEEICRRFCIKNSHDFDVKKFRQKCIADGVPDKWLDFEKWQVQTEQVLGGGNRAMEIAEANELFQNIQAFDPSAQQEIKHDWALAITGNPSKARRLAPINAKKAVTASVHDAQQSFGTLMRGVDMEPVEGLSHTEQVGALLACMAHEIEGIMQTGGMGTPRDVTGLQNVAKFIIKHLEIMAQDDKNKPLVKKFGDDLSRLMNLVRAFEQRQQQAMEAAAKQGGQGQQGPDPTVIAKAQGTILQDTVKAKAKEASAQQKLRHTEQKFQQSQRLKTLETVAGIQRKGVEQAMQPAKPSPTKPAK